MDEGGEGECEGGRVRVSEGEEGFSLVVVRCLTFLLQVAMLNLHFTPPARTFSKKYVSYVRQ